MKSKMGRKLPMVLAVALVCVLLVPTASAETADESAEVTIPAPANQTTTVSVVVADDGTTTLTVTEEGNVTNESVQVSLPNDVFGLVSDVEELASDIVDLIIEVCDFIINLPPGSVGKC